MTHTDGLCAMISYLLTKSLGDNGGQALGRGVVAWLIILRGPVGKTAEIADLALWVSANRRCAPFWGRGCGGVSVDGGGCWGFV